MKMEKSMIERSRMNQLTTPSRGYEMFEFGNYGSMKEEEEGEDETDEMEEEESHRIESSEEALPTSSVRSSVHKNARDPKNIHTIQDAVNTVSMSYKDDGEKKATQSSSIRYLQGRDEYVSCLEEVQYSSKYCASVHAPNTPVPEIALYLRSFFHPHEGIRVGRSSRSTGYGENSNHTRLYHFNRQSEHL
ncbi:hypothetical protein PENTCL1PPCAC_14125 [Pristionchus entomophagus]|uniref:Uncharacterized protein n=1 Tax=Pristionchus entomophagus TaxID=358040 RepID=A0AAV5TFM5_9BILA|nr:hypothetical protein PENTCL1PPCAC_14125 [Pristionchus entomophagus]